MSSNKFFHYKYCFMLVPEKLLSHYVACNFYFLTTDKSVQCLCICKIPPVTFRTMKNLEHMTTHSCNSAVNKHTHADILQCIMPEPRRFIVVSYLLYGHSGQTVNLLYLYINFSLPYKSNVHYIKYRSQKVHQVLPEILTKCWMTYFYTFFVIYFTMLPLSQIIQSYDRMTGE
jgi:hypothetical protein